MLAKLLCGRRTRNDFSAAEPQQWNLLLGRTCLDSVPAAEGDLLVRPDHPGAAAEIVSKFYASEKKDGNVVGMELLIQTQREEAKN